MVPVCEGQTVFIPSGWIHASYNLQDTIVLLGYFFHSYSTSMHLKILEQQKRCGEDAPFTFGHLHWCILEEFNRKFRSNIF